MSPSRVTRARLRRPRLTGGRLVFRADCVEPNRWRYADGSRCISNSFCDWSVPETDNEWNSIPSLTGASVGALLDGKEQFPYKIQALPGNHKLQYFICQKSGRPSDGYAT